LDIKKKLSAQSERVKSVDLHPSEPWVLAALYSGIVMIWDYETGGCVKSFEVSELPVRCAKFISRKQWFVAASDDMRMRVFNYNTMEKIKEFEAHADYIRSLEVHPNLPYVLSSSDDMTIKLWDWDRGFDCTQIFEGHAHYVMQVKINPKDTNTFASASLDRTIKVWGLGSHTPHYTLEGHERGVNCLDYYPSGDKPYILSGADDRTVKIWDYQVRENSSSRRPGGNILDIQSLTLSIPFILFRLNPLSTAWKATPTMFAPSCSTPSSPSLPPPVRMELSASGSLPLIGQRPL
jgi:coatomer subunit beta'